MRGLHQRYRHLADLYRAAPVEARALDARHRREPVDQLENAVEMQPALLGNIHAVLSVIEMPMRKQHGGCAIQRLIGPLLGEGGIVLYPGIEQQHLICDLDPKTAMTHPGDTHHSLLALDS